MAAVDRALEILCKRSFAERLADGIVELHQHYCTPKRETVLLVVFWVSFAAVTYAALHL